MQRTGIFAVLAIFLPFIADAHAFGEVHTLPLPFHYYALGAAGALVASFGVLAFLSTRPVTSTPVMSLTFPRALQVALQVLGLALYFLAIISAFFGADSSHNPALGVFWILFLLGVMYLSVIFGGLWRWMSPFETLGRLFGRTQPLSRYPEQWGTWPAFGLFFGIIWLELFAGPISARPSFIGLVLVVLGVFAIVGTRIFGADMWFRHGDPFSVLFSLVGRIAPVQFRGNTIELVRPTTRLTEAAPHVSVVFFILLLLSSTAIDSLRETVVWWDLFYSNALQAAIYQYQVSAVLLVSPFIYFALFAGALFLAKSITGVGKSVSELSRAFAYSLIPIAVGYHIAHYFSLLAAEGQKFVANISDPLGKKWDLIGTASFRGAEIPPDAMWAIQFWAILIGHIIAAYIAHRIALTVFANRKHVILGQLPVLLLMVAYTVFGLWILIQGYAQP